MVRASRFRTLLVLGAALAGLVVGVLGTVVWHHATRHAAAAAPTHTVTVSPPGPANTDSGDNANARVATVQLLGSTSSANANINMTHDNRCFGRGPWAYLDAEAPVTITDPSSGQILATSKLSQGDLIDGACQFTFAVPSLPSMSQYGVRIVDATTVVSQVRIQTGLILRAGSCCDVPASEPGGVV